MLSKGSNLKTLILHKVGLQLTASPSHNSSTQETSGINKTPFVTMFAHPRCKIASLKLSSNNLGLESCLCISHALVLNQQIRCPLTRLDLAKNNIGAKGMHLLAESLKENRSLKFLNISSNNIQDSGALAVSKLLKAQAKGRPLSANECRMSCLREILMSDNSISSQGLVPLIHALTPKQLKNEKFNQR